MSKVKYYGVSILPEDPKSKKQYSFNPTKEQKERAQFVSQRLSLMEEEKAKYIEGKRIGLRLYDGVIEDDQSRNPIKAVAPLARIFVESKTSEQVKASSDPILIPVDDENDAWRAEIGEEMLAHVRRVTNAKAKDIELTRMANIIGQSVAFKGFKQTSVMMRYNIIEKGKLKSVEKTVQGHGEIFKEIIDPLSEFWIDPQASGIHDALDCVLFFSKNHEEFAETFGDTELYDIEGIEAGSNGMVDGCMYFKKPSASADMLVIYAWASKGASIHGMKPENVKEVFFGGLPDDHKMLPFVTKVNVPTFTQNFFKGFSRSSSGEAASNDSTNFGTKQKFWAYAGDPLIIADLIEIRTDFGRSMYRACELAGKFMVATKGNFRIDNSIDWQHGDQIVGGAGQFETVNFGSANLAAFSSTLDDVYQLMIQATGTDPRNLTDSKQKTLGETIAQRDSQFTRLQAIIDYNDEVSGVRDVMIDYKLCQQWYTEKMFVSLTGVETEEELKQFDDFEGIHPKTGGPLMGKKYRTIRTSKKYFEEQKKGKMSLKSGDSGKYSLTMRPEYVLTSEMDVVPMTRKKAGELQALKATQIQEGINMYLQLLQLLQGQPEGTDPIVELKDLPPLSEMLNEYWQMMGVAGKRKTRGTTEKKIEEIKELRQTMNASRKPISEIVPTSEMPAEALPTGQPI